NPKEIPWTETRDEYVVESTGSCHSSSDSYSSFVKSDNAMPLHSHVTTWSRISNFYEKLYALLEPSILWQNTEQSGRSGFAFMEKIALFFSLCEGDCRVEKFRNQKGNTL
ncbi:hypothetical protein IFM89_005159, partial [Coptis chinensis]